MPTVSCMSCVCHPRLFEDMVRRHVGLRQILCSRLTRCGGGGMVRDFLRLGFVRTPDDELNSSCRPNERNTTVVWRGPDRRGRVSDPARTGSSSMDAPGNLTSLDPVATAAQVLGSGSFPRMFGKYTTGTVFH